MSMAGRPLHRLDQQHEPAPDASYDQPMGAEDELEDFELEHEPLARRLRSMTWPGLPSDLRERCWREFQERVEHLRRGSNGDESTLDG